MDRSVALLVTVSIGAALAAQAPLNSALGRVVGGVGASVVALGISFAALFASIGAGTGGPAGAAAVVAGVFCGSVAWWAILTGVVAGLRTRMTPRPVRWLNIASAVIIGGFGIAAILFGVVAA